MMVNRSWIGAVAFGLVPLAGQAQIAASDCRALFDALLALDIPDIAADVSAQDGACIYSNVLMASTERTVPNFTADRITLRLDDASGLIGGQRPPHEIDIAINNFRIIPQVDEPFATLLWAQAYWNVIDMHFAARWDADSNRIEIANAEMDFFGPNRIAFAATLEAVDMRSFGSVQTSLGGMEMTHLTAEIHSEGLFETFALSPLLNLTTGQDARADLERLIADLQAGIDRLPDRLTGAGSRAAMSEIVGDLPNPGGTVTVDLVARPGLSAQRFSRFALFGVPRNMDDLMPALEGVTISVDYDRVRPE